MFKASKWTNVTFCIKKEKLLTFVGSQIVLKQFKLYDIIFEEHKLCSPSLNQEVNQKLGFELSAPKEPTFLTLLHITDIDSTCRLQKNTKTNSVS
jgi:hypothetical protein